MNIFRGLLGPRSPERKEEGAEKKSAAEGIRALFTKLFPPKPKYAKATPGRSQAISVQNINWADTTGVNNSADRPETAQELSDSAIMEKAEGYSKCRATPARQKSQVDFEWRGSSFPPAPVMSESADLYTTGIPKAPAVPSGMGMQSIPAQRIGNRPRITRPYSPFIPSADVFPPEGPPAEPYRLSPSFAPKIDSSIKVRRSIETVVGSLPNRSGVVSMIRRENVTDNNERLAA